MDTSNFWFFTLSAIPQTLASVVALTATFMLFKLSKINESIDIHCYHLEIILRSLYKEMLIPKKPEHFLKLFKKEILSDDENWIGQMKDFLLGAYGQIVRDPSSHALSTKEMIHWLDVKIKKDFVEKMEIRKKILDYLKISLSLICFTIIFCLLFLPLFDVLSDFAIILVVVVSVVLAAVSIVVTSVSIFRIVRM